MSQFITCPAACEFMNTHSHANNFNDADIVAKVEHYLGGKLDSPPLIHVVRDVAPGKLMLCVSFHVPEAVAFNGREGGAAAGRDKVGREVEVETDNEVKRQKT